MAEIGAQGLHVPHDRLRIVPASFQRSHRKCMAQIVQPGSGTSRSAISELADDPDEDHVDPGRRRGTAMAEYEKIIAGIAHDVLYSNFIAIHNNIIRILLR